MKTNSLLIFIVSLVLFAGVLVAAWQVRDGIVRKVEVVKIHRQKEEQSKNQEFGTQLRLNIEEINRQEETMTKVFLRQEEIVPLITQLESLAAINGLSIAVEKVEYGDAVSVGSYAVKPTRLFLNVEGPYRSLALFLDAARRFDQVLVTKEIKLYQTEEGRYDMRILLEGSMLTI